MAQYEAEINGCRDQGQEQGKANIGLASAGKEVGVIAVRFPVHVRPS